MYDRPCWCKWWYKLLFRNAWLGIVYFPTVPNHKSHVIIELSHGDMPQCNKSRRSQLFCSNGPRLEKEGFRFQICQFHTSLKYRISFYVTRILLLISFLNLLHAHTHARTTTHTWSTYYMPDVVEHVFCHTLISSTPFVLLIWLYSSFPPPTIYGRFLRCSLISFVIVLFITITWSRTYWLE